MRYTIGCPSGRHMNDGRCMCTEADQRSTGVRILHRLVMWPTSTPSLNGALQGCIVAGVLIGVTALIGWLT